MFSWIIPRISPGNIRNSREGIPVQTATRHSCGVNIALVISVVAVSCLHAQAKINEEADT